MSCYHPLRAFDIGERTESGKIKYLIESSKISQVRKSNGLYQKEFVEIPCGSCIGCRLDYAKQWAIRCCLEAAEYKDNYFVTLTYDDENLPLSHSVNKEDPRKFINSLRKSFERKGHHGIRFVCAGEYGTKSARPHYHLILFNCPMDDLELACVNNGHSYWRSKTLENIWKKGYVSIGLAEYDSMSYVAQYILKKQKGEAAECYKKLGIQPEFFMVSNHPGIGAKYFENNFCDIYNRDLVFYPFKKNLGTAKPPRYFDRLYEKIDPEKLQNLKDGRQCLAWLNKLNKLKLTDLSAESYLAAEEYNFIQKTKILNKRSSV